MLPQVEVEMLLHASAGALALLVFAIGVQIANGRRRRATKRELELTRAQLRGALETASIGISILHTDGSPILRNRAYAEMLGYTVEEFADLPHKAYMPSETLEVATERLGRMLSGDVPREPGPRRYQHRDGHMIDVVGQAAPIEVDGEAAGLVITIRDVTQELAAERNARATEAQFRAAFDTSAVGISVSSADGRTFRRNKAFADMLGYSIEKFTDLPPAAFWSPEEYARVNGLRKHALSQHRPMEPILRQYKHRDGHLVDVIWQSEPTVVDGEAVGFVSVVRDVTSELAAEKRVRESEEQYRALFETGRKGHIVVDRDHRLRFANEAAALLLGRDRNDLIGTEYGSLVHPDEREQATSAVERLLNVPAEPGTRQSSRRMRQLLTSAETAVTVAVTGSLFREGGEVAGAHFEWTDLTETLRLQDELLQAQKLEAVGTLVAGVAHDFNNLLTGIGGSIEMAQTTDDTGLWLDRAQMSAARASQLVQQLLAFSRHSDGTRELVDLAEITSEAVVLLRQTGDRRIDLQCEVEESLGPVWGVSSELHQVLLNLLVNSRDAVEERLASSSESSSYEPKITVAVTHIDDPEKVESRIRVRVSDNGDGIPPEAIDRIFEPFFTTKEVDRGTGLGLASVYGIARNHGGDVNVDSAAGEGTTFTVELPVASISRATSENVANGDRGDSPGGLVLIVDDEEIIGEVIAGLLTTAGFETMRAATGTQALDLAARQRPDLVLLDVNMPAPNGWEVLGSLLTSDPTVPVLMVSGYAVEDEALRRGARGLVAKPFDADEVAEQIRTPAPTVDAVRN